MIDGAFGAQLDTLARDRFNMVRNYGESDAQFRKRMMRALGKASTVAVGPIRIYDRHELEKVYGMLVSAAGGVVLIRQTLEAIINMQNMRGGGASWPAGSMEQVIYDVAEGFKAEGILVDGVELPSGQRTRASVNLDSLKTWYAAMTLILDDGEE